MDLSEHHEPASESPHPPSGHPLPGGEGRGEGEPQVHGKAADGRTGAREQGQGPVESNHTRRVTNWLVPDGQGAISRAVTVSVSPLPSSIACTSST